MDDTDGWMDKQIDIKAVLRIAFSDRKRKREKKMKEKEKLDWLGPVSGLLLELVLNCVC